MPKIVFDEDAEIVIPESTKKIQDNDILESSDDEAPEAVSTSKAKQVVISKVQAEKEATAKLAAAEKEKRRLRDQFLKEQKLGSKRQQRELERKARKERLEQEYRAKVERQKRQREEEEEEAEESKDETDDEQDEQSNLLPQDLLQQALQEEQEEQIQNKKHISAQDFEIMMAQQEEKEKERAKKRKTEQQGKVVGEYTVKVLNNRPKLQRANKRMMNMRDMHLHRKAVPRKEAVVNISSGRDGAALVFRRT